MNFIKMISLFLLSSVFAFVLYVLHVIQYDEIYYLFLGIGIFFLVTGIITIFVMIFQNMGFRKEQMENLNEIKLKKKLIRDQEEHLQKYMNTVTESMTKIYPEFEKEIFKNISPKDAKNLQVYLTEYPELKFKGILRDYIAGIENKNNKILDLKRDLNRLYTVIANLQDSEWYLFKFDIPEEYKQEIYN